MFVKLYTGPAHSQGWKVILPISLKMPIGYCFGEIIAHIVCVRSFSTLLLGSGVSKWLWIFCREWSVIVQIIRHRTLRVISDTQWTFMSITTSQWVWWKPQAGPHVHLTYCSHDFMLCFQDYLKGVDRLFKNRLSFWNPTLTYLLKSSSVHHQRPPALLGASLASVMLCPCDFMSPCPPVVIDLPPAGIGPPGIYTWRQYIFFTHNRKCQ